METTTTQIITITTTTQSNNNSSLFHLVCSLMACRIGWTHDLSPQHADLHLDLLAAPNCSLSANNNNNNDTNGVLDVLKTWCFCCYHVLLCVSVLEHGCWCAKPEQ
jgi:hypothetical protein